MANKNKILLTEKISSLLFKQSLPAIIGMIVMSLYNVIDTIFIGQGVGTLALAGVTISMPLIMGFSAVSQALGIGFSSIISRALGAKNYTKVHQTLGNFLILSISIGIILTLGLSFSLKSLLPLFGASPEVFAYAFEYAQIVVWGGFFFILFTGSIAIIRSIGEAKAVMFIMIASTIVNIGLDYLFIFPMNMGLAGAAWATVIAWVMGTVISAWYIIGPKSHFKLKLEDFRFKINIVKEALALGFSSFARQISSTLEMIILNKSLSYYGSDILIAGFGIIMRLGMLGLMPIVGIVQGMQPIAGANFGARKFARVKSLTKMSIKYATIFSCFSFVMVMLFPRQLLQIFTSDPEVINSTAKALRIFALGLPLVGFQVIAGGFYQALGFAKKAFLITTLRQTVLLIPLLIILPLVWQLNGLFASFPIADYLSVIITFIIFQQTYRNLQKLGPEKQEEST